MPFVSPHCPPPPPPPPTAKNEPPRNPTLHATRCQFTDVRETDRLSRLGPSHLHNILGAHGIRCAPSNTAPILNSAPFKATSANTAVSLPQHQFSQSHNQTHQSGPAQTFDPATAGPKGSMPTHQQDRSAVSLIGLEYIHIERERTNKNIK